MKEQPKAVVFDFDGTLVDTMGDFADIASRVISKLYDVDPSSARKMYLETSGLPFFQQLEILFPDNKKNKQASKEFETNKLINFFSNKIPEDVKKTAKYLQSRGIYVVVSSNNFQHLVRKFIRQTKDVKFDLVLGCKKNFFKGKDHFNYIKKYFDLSEKEILFVGDSLKDAERAIQSGVSFIGKLGTFKRIDFEKKYPDIKTISRISDLISIFEEKI